MKRIGIGFTAIIAILAMSFTFASKSHSAKVLVKDDPADGCFTSIRVQSLVTPPSFFTYTDNFLSLVNIKTLTPATVGFPAALNTAIHNYIVTSVGIEVTNPTDKCPWLNNIKYPICCYKLKAKIVNGVTVYVVEKIRFGTLVP